MAETASWSREGARLRSQEHAIRLILTIAVAAFAATASGLLSNGALAQVAVLLMAAALLLSRFVLRAGRAPDTGIWHTVGTLTLVLLDLSAITLLVIATGGATSGFFVLYVVAISLAAISLRRLHLALLTSLAMTAYVLICWETLLGGDQTWDVLARLLGLGLVSGYVASLASMLRREERARDRLLGHLAEGVMLFDQKARLMLASEPMLRWLGLEDFDELVGTPHERLIQAGGLLGWAVAEVGLGGIPGEGTTRVGSFPEAGLPLVECSTIPYGGIQGREGWVVVCKDLRAQTSELRCSVGPSIETLSPLANLRTLTQTLYDMASHLEEDERGQAVESIQRHVTALQSILADMLHASYEAPTGSARLDLSFVEVPNFLQGLRRLLEIARSGRETSVEIYMADSLPEISVDRAAISQSLLQLCKGLLALAAHDDHLAIDVQPAGDHIRFALQLANDRDPVEIDLDGQAMSCAEAAELFAGTEAFAIIEAHDGRWECIPRDGRVRRVVVELPLTGPRQADTVSQEKVAEARRQLSEIAAGCLELDPVLAAEVSNQLKNSLSVIRGYAEMALRSAGVERKDRALELAIGLSDQAAELVDSLQPTAGQFPHENNTAVHVESITPSPPALLGKILVVDDDASMRRLLLDTLEDAGYQTAGAEDGLQALDFIRRTPPAMMFVDLSMPGLSGVDVMREVRQSIPELPVVLMTGYTYNLAMQALGEEKPYAVIGKPFSINEVLSIVREVASGEVPIAAGSA